MEIKLTLSDLDVKCLKNDLLDIQDFFEKAKNGQINTSKKGLIKEWQQKLMADPDVDVIPANEVDLIELVISRSDYKNRAERAEEEKIKMEEEAAKRLADREVAAEALLKEGEKNGTS